MSQEVDSNHLLFFWWLSCHCRKPHLWEGPTEDRPVWWSPHRPAMRDMVISSPATVGIFKYYGSYLPSNRICILCVLINWIFMDFHVQNLDICCHNLPRSYPNNRIPKVQSSFLGHPKGWKPSWDHHEIGWKHVQCRNALQYTTIALGKSCTLW